MTLRILSTAGAIAVAIAATTFASAPASADNGSGSNSGGPQNNCSNPPNPQVLSDCGWAYATGNLRAPEDSGPAYGYRGPYGYGRPYGYENYGG